MGVCKSTSDSIARRLAAKNGIKISDALRVAGMVSTRIIREDGGFVYSVPSNYYDPYSDKVERVLNTKEVSVARRDKNEQKAMIAAALIGWDITVEDVERVIKNTSGKCKEMIQAVAAKVRLPSGRMYTQCNHVNHNKPLTPDEIRKGKYGEIKRGGYSYTKIPDDIIL